MKQLLLLFIFFCSFNTAHSAQMNQSQTMMAQSIEEHILWKIYNAIDSDNIDLVRCLLRELKASDLHDAFFAENYQIPPEHDEKITSLLPFPLNHPDPSYYQWAICKWTIRARPPLFWAKSRKMAQLLISAGVSAKAMGHYPDVNVLAYSLGKDNLELTTFYIFQCPFGEALVYAIRSEKLHMIKLLISAGADLETASQKVSKAKDWLVNTTSGIQRAIKEGQRELAYYQDQRKLVEEQSQLVPVISNIIKDYTFGQVPEDLHMQKDGNNSWCAIQ